MQVASIQRYRAVTARLSCITPASNDVQVVTCACQGTVLPEWNRADTLLLVFTTQRPASVHDQRSVGAHMTQGGSDPRVAVPGETVLTVPATGQLVLGPGLVCQDDQILATRAGVVKQTASGNRVWLESRQKRYIPAEGDVVVGTILDRHGDNFTVDIRGPFAAQLPQLAFEGATRRNRPAVKSGDLVYARVVSASRDIEPELSCMDSLGRAAGYGHLKDGLSIQVSSALARQLLAAPPPAVLEALGSQLQFDLAVGLNGRVWVCTPTDPKDPAPGRRAAVVVANAILKSEFLSEQQARTLVSRMLKTLQ